jgi:hypothetical protein
MMAIPTIPAPIIIAVATRPVLNISPPLKKT